MKQYSTNSNLVILSLHHSGHDNRVCLLDSLAWFAQPEQGLMEPPALDFNLRLGLTGIQPESLRLTSDILPRWARTQPAQDIQLIEMPIEHVCSSTCLGITGLRPVKHWCPYYSLFHWTDPTIYWARQFCSWTRRFSWYPAFFDCFLRIDYHSVKK